MFKKTEETEWTRFSKALSNRDDTDAQSEEEPSSSEASSGSDRNAAGSSAPAQRPPTSDVTVSSRSTPRTAPADNASEVESLIGEHTTVDGSFKSDNSIRVRGSVQGEIESQSSILVEEQAHVNAKVTAETVTVSGQVDGQIHCAGRVEIRPTGRVIGEIHAGTLIMQEGAFFEGNLKMGDQATQMSVSEPQAAASKSSSGQRAGSA